ncbi:hypothetical protein [Streptomyces venezuelae]|uniref:hypothetical protein n=1 Tax=Streptomyces venezuelae TaxID=54571 RepID=UPI003661BFC9
MHTQSQVRAGKGAVVAAALLALGTAGCGGTGDAPTPDPQEPSSVSAPGGGAPDGSTDGLTATAEQPDGAGDAGGGGGDDIRPVGSPPTDTGGTPEPSPELTDVPDETPCEDMPTPASTCTPSPDLSSPGPSAS